MRLREGKRARFPIENSAADVADVVVVVATENYSRYCNIVTGQFRGGGNRRKDGLRAAEKQEKQERKGEVEREKERKRAVAGCEKLTLRRKMLSDHDDAYGVPLPLRIQNIVSSTATANYPSTRVRGGDDPGERVPGVSLRRTIAERRDASRTSQPPLLCTPTDAHTL